MHIFVFLKYQIFKIPSTSYWQAGPVWEVWWRSYFNNAKILSQEVLKPFTLVFNYNPNDLEKNLSEKNLKLAYSEDGKVWKILSNTLLNTTNKTIAIVTKKGGYYMLVSK
jgi:hypothetical protein